MVFDIALSTMWAIGQFQSLADFFDAGRKLGFTRFELNHAIDSAMLEGLSLNGTITSIHEPCPADLSATALKERNWLVSAPDEENRRQGVAAIRRSIDLAHKLGVRVVIVHPGRVDVDPTLESTLLNLYKAGKFNQPEYAQARERLVTARAAQAPVNMRSVRRSLIELAEYAAQMGIRLGLENRFHYHEIPLPDELDDLLDLGCGEVIGYWHDVGHAQVLQNLGFYTHEEWLRRFAGPQGRVIGVHLHDVVGLTDHLAPGLGQVDWDMVASYLPASARLTCEFQPFNSPQEVAAGVKRLKGYLMSASNTRYSPDLFSEILYGKMKQLNAGIEELELYEFRYALDNLYPEKGWASVTVDEKEEIEKLINNSSFYSGIQLKPRVGDRIVLDEKIVRLTTMLFVGLVTEEYPEEWVRAHFYFDIRGFYFLHRTVYFTDQVLAHLGGKPFKSFEQRQKRFERDQDIGYKHFKEANAQVDGVFIESVKKLIAAKGTPIVLAIAGPTAAGKTEIVARLRRSFEQAGKRVTSIELDNFLTDRDQREEKGVHSLGKQAIHFELFRQSLEDISQGRKITIPRYDFVYATSSHDLDGNLKAGCTPLEIEPADIIFVEGNFPFLLKEVTHLIGIKVVYLTDDAIRLKRKWKRDMDYRKKYEPTYFRNRFFRDQFLMAQKCYLPQMEVCDIVVDTTGAALWATPEIAEILSLG